ncbi:hypothetical protein ACLMJK_007656 [Lecanora helva]
MAPPKIAIIGAGIAGPAAAIGLARNGHDVTIYERLPDINVTGYAFGLTPNSDRCLKYLGVDAQAGGAPVFERGIAMDTSGKILWERRGREENKYGAVTGTTAFVYRPTLHRQLIKAALELNVKIRSNQRVTNCDTESSVITLESGERVFADLIIGADGIHSYLRQWINDNNDNPLKPSSGHSAIRFMIPRSAVQGDASLLSLVEEANMFTWRGNGSEDGKQIIVYPVDFEEQINVVCTYDRHLTAEETSNADDATAVAYNQKASLQTVKDIFRNFEPRAQRLIELADSETFRMWELLDMDDIPRWTNNHAVMIGDACHPVLPFGFSGASMGIEDAITLSVLFPADTPKGNEIAARLELYEKIRRPRVARVRDYSREVARGVEDLQRAKDYRYFLMSHDAVKFAEDALRDFNLEEATKKIA